MARTDYVRVVPGRYLVITRKINGNIMTEVEANDEKEAEKIMNDYLKEKGIISSVLAVCKIPEIIGCIN